ncbi:hypothetical protein [Thermoplasma acidophilum]|uniref:Uncharacterized protein n=1 Tax=Thermoplasma acidophilum (strain ATCC 25905 / DSM 1728 / JCM 9062 / NBRC 15155 / AMRC-C165) TaxID=273075 RepID=Q9HJL0_THEAC|nr:hypothetical protein [Thermoplasma acidophilum]CAC12086.1 hypothetical protein [Thermoplasma acidophilum]
MSFEECFNHIEDEEEAAECIHCLKKHGEQVMFDDDLGRLVLGREIYDDRYVEKMKELTKLLSIKNRKDYEFMDRKYNLTMY